MSHPVGGFIPPGTAHLLTRARSAQLPACGGRSSLAPRERFVDEPSCGGIFARSAHPVFPAIIYFIAILVCLLASRPSVAQSHYGRAGSVSDLLAIATIQPKDELRALWVVRFDLASKEEIDRLIDLAVRARFHVLFAQVRGRADAYYRSSFEPPGFALARPPSEFDPLEYLLRNAHEAGIQVHAWVNVLYVWSDGSSVPPEDHVTRVHPDWIVTDSEGHRMNEFPVDYWTKRGLEGYFLSPALPAVREYTAAIIEDIANRYAIDGVHLDYIRYPGKLFGYSEAERTEFALRYGVDPMLLVGDRFRVTDVIGETGAESLDADMIEWRIQQVDTLVAAIRQAVPDLPLSAAVIPDLDEARRKGQDWAGWIRDRNVDFVVLMAYNYRPDDLRQRIHVLENVMSPDRFIVGLPLFDGRAQYLDRSVSLLREEGVLGFSLFSYRQLADNPFSIKFLDSIFLDRAGEETQDTPADTLEAPPEE